MSDGVGVQMPRTTKEMDEDIFGWDLYHLCEQR